MSTLTTMQTNVANELGLDNSVSGDQSAITGWLNQGVLDMLMRTRCYVTSATMTTTAGSWQYTLDTGVLLIDEIWMTSAGTNYRFLEAGADEIVDLQIANGVTTSSPALRYALKGANLLLVWPTPQSSTDTINLLYVPRPTAMSASGNDPSTSTYGGIPAEFHDRIEWYACWRGASMSDDASSGQGERYRQIYTAEVGRMMAQIQGKANPRIAPARVNARRARLVAHDPSADWN